MVGMRSFKKDTFFRMGPKVEVALRPKTDISAPFLGPINDVIKHDMLELFGNFTYLWEPDGTLGATDYFETGIRFALDKSQQVVLEASYRNGQQAPKFVDVEIFQVGIGVKL